jgi:hypothetical protein
VLALAMWGTGRAEPLPTAPLLRIETGRHTAFIHALAIDEAADRVYSASEDKTVRVWRASDGRLLDTFRVPAGARAEGQLYALALSPDHRLLAVAGWTCWDSESAACIYLLDAATGALVARLRGLPEVVAALRFSANGQYLAAGLMGGQGLRVFNVRERTLVAEDRAYRDKLLELDFGPRGGLVATGLDGFVRLYDASFRLIGRVDAGLAGHQPFGVRYSPDGRFVAIGFNDVASISVLSTLDLAPVVTLRAAAGGGSTNLTRLAWSRDSAMIYGVGEPDGAGASPLFRWHMASPQQSERVPNASGRIGDLLVTADGSVIFGADDPALVRIDAAGMRRYAIGSGIPDYRNAGARFRVSRDGLVIEVPGQRAGGGVRKFSVIRDGTGGAIVGPVAAALAPPLMAASGWTITPGRAQGPTSFEGMHVNGKAIPLEPYEQLRAYALAPAGASLFVGTEWALRSFDKTLHQRWEVRTSTTVLAINATADGRFVLAALADGSIQWYSAINGELVLSCFLHADGEGWVVWTPEGTYSSSTYGDLLVGWQINRGPDAAPDFFRAVQFERELYQPNVIAARLQEYGRVATRTMVSGAGAAHMLAIVPPRLDIAVLNARAGGATLRISGESARLPMQDLAVYVNDIPVTAGRQRRLGAGEAAHFVRDVPIALGARDNEVRVEVFNGRSLGVAERFLPGLEAAPGAAAPAAAVPIGDLYVLAAGANQFPGLSPSQYLSYAASDAEGFARAVQANGTRQFRKVHVQTLSDLGRPATKANVLAALQWMAAQATGADTIIVFLASHGISDAAGNYFFVPRDVHRADLDALLDGKSLPGESSLIGWLPFFEILRNAAGRRLMIVDTCQARNISGRFADYSLVKRSASSHIAFILASKGDEESQEYTPAQHGLFTFALLEGLRAGPRTPSASNGPLTVAQWFSTAAGLVERLRDRSIGPQSPQLIAPPALLGMPIPTAVGTQR